MGRVLVIDVERSLEGTRTQLSALGHAVLIATDTYTGFTFASREHPDLIMVGLSLPGGGGVKMLERLRGNSITVSTPVVLLVDPSDKILDVPQDPLVRLLRKPTASNEMKAVIDELLPPASEPDAPAFESDEGGFAAPEPFAPSSSPRPMPMDMGAPSDDELPPGEILEL
jgi:DNA-binding response OmpR family regulator